MPRAQRPNEAELSQRTAVVIGEGPNAGAIRQLLADRGARVRPEWPGEPGGLDILVFVASERRRGPIAETEPDQFREDMGATLKAAFFSLQEGVEAIRGASGHGAVVFVAPSSPLRSFDAIQSGLRLLARAAALELGPEGIRVNTVFPGPTAEVTRLGRPCEASDVAKAVLFAASDRSSFMTGAELIVDGGRMVA
ncbi:MAG TPA: SDR family oxidoreductase [Caulobacteraceae bacterium]|nr:SDR family oxidoreductase [Caulobacteraceae bacterium]